MAFPSILFRALCVTMCLHVTQLLASEDSAQEFIEHMLRIPNPDKVLNSVLGRLERNRQYGLSAGASQQYDEDEDCEDSELLAGGAWRALPGRLLHSRDPSGILNVNNISLNVLPEYTETLKGLRERGLRQLGVQKHYPICHLERKIRRLNTNEYEYRPAYYEEVRCTVAFGDDSSVNNEICSSLGFSCVQWNKTIHLTRRRYSSDCWETKTMVIPAGCECMWPVHRLGDINLHV